MKTSKNIFIVLALAVLAVAAQAAETVYVPLSVADKIKTTESTKLDIGEPKAIFDLNESTLIRTPSINPAFVRVEFTEPITFEHLRIILIETQHTWSLAVADNMADLKAKSGSYRQLFRDQKTADGRIEANLDKPVKASAIELDVKRTEGDDYVHIAELQFCVPGKAEGLRILQVKDRRDQSIPKGMSEVEGKITKPVNTVVVFQARALASGTEIKVDKSIKWQAMDDGIAPFGPTGEFLIKKTGEHQLVARYGDIERTITLEGTPRTAVNRKPDIDVLYIERLPRIAYDGPNQGLPVPGSKVTWRAHVYNWGSKPVSVRYEWKLDGKTVKTGKVNIPVGPPGFEAKAVDLPWKWDQIRHDLRFTATPAKQIDEIITNNNTVTIQTNAVTVGFWVEQSLWDFFHENQYRLPTNDANSFADWSERMMRQWNSMFVEAKYKVFPEGIKERVRLDRLVVVPDFALPLAGGIPSNNPDLRDKTVDMEWGHESGDITSGTQIVPESHWWSPERAIKALDRGDVANRKVDPPFWCGLGYIHEMGHARYLVDTYGFDVHSGTCEDASKCSIKVTDEKGLIVGRYMPAGAVHFNKYPGQMGSDYFRYSVFEAMAWNRVVSQRARGGNCNSPDCIGEYLQEFPKKLVYQYFDTDGKPLAGAEVWVYRAHGTGDGWYTKVYEDQPAVKVTADDQGRVNLDKLMFSADGKIVHTYGFANSVVLLRITYGGQHYYMFEETSDPNVAYDLGYKDEYTFKRQIKLRTGDPSPKEWSPSANWDVPGTELNAKP